MDLLTTKVVAMHPEAEPWFPVALTSEDRKQLADLLPSLPSLHGNMTKEEREAFLREYTQLPLTQRPHWVPSVPSGEQLYAESVETLEVASRHQGAIRDAVRARTIRAIGPDHIQVTELAPHTRLWRPDVVKYLNDCGLSVRPSQSEPAQVGDPGEVVNFASNDADVPFPSEGGKPATWFDMLKPSGESQSSLAPIDAILANEAQWPIRTNGQPWLDHEIVLLKELRSRVGRRGGLVWAQIEKIFDSSRQNLLEVLKTKT